MAVLPTRIVEVEFDAGTWTDVTADHVAFTSRRGRNRELGAFETGQLVLTLRNDTRKYDPDNTAGTYYGKLRPNRRVRVRATYNAVTYPIFLGYIDRIAQVSGGPNDATAEFTVSDAFKVLNRVELPSSVWASEVAADTPAYWWRLGDPAGSAAVVDAAAGKQLATFGAPSLGAAGLVTRDGDGALSMADTTSGFAAVDQYLAAALGTVTIEAIVKTTATAGTFLAVSNKSDGQRFRLRLSAGNVQFGVGKTAAGNTSETFATGGAINDGNPHHVAGVYNAADGTWNMRLYVDGTQVGTANAPAGTLVATQEITVGNVADGYQSPSAHADGLVGTVDEAVVYAAVLSSTRIAAHYAARAAPWNGDLPGTRLGRILDLAAVPTGDRNIDAGTTTLQNSSLGGTALAYAQKIEETEAGYLFVARDGKVRFIGRQAAVTGAYLTSLATITDADAGAGLGYRSTSGDVDEAIIITRATVSRDGAAAVVVFDAAAKTEFGWLDATHEGLLHSSDAYSLAYAQWLVNSHKAPSSRVGTVTLELPGDPVNLYPGILALEIGDRITYKRKPQNVGATLTVDMRVEAVSHAAGAGYWTTQLQLTPFDIAAGLPVFVWDVTKWDQHVWGY